MPEGLERSLLLPFLESGDALEAAAPPFDVSAASSRLREAAQARGLLRPGDMPEDDLAVTSAELEQEAPVFDVEAGATQLRAAARDRGLLPGAAPEDSRFAAARTEENDRLNTRLTQTMPSGGVSAEQRHYQGLTVRSGEGFWDLLSGTEQAGLSALGRTMDFPPGATMCFKGEPATHVFILMAGWVKALSTSSDGHEMVLAFRGHGDIVGEVAGENTSRRNATVRAVDRVRALILGYHTFTAFLDAYPGAARAYRRVMTQRLKDAAVLHRHPVTSGAQRLAGVVLEIAAQHGRVAGSEIDVAMPLSQQELAALAGTSRATVTRALHNWRQRGYIRTGQRRITITNVQGLRQVAGQQAQEARSRTDMEIRSDALLHGM
jgi:CRP-like cAMP-binding protein